jgi:hypothetical protein
MKLSPADIQFHEDVRLLMWRPRGVLNEAALEQIVTLIGDLEASSEIPFNRFTDTTAADAIDLNFRHVFHVALFRPLLRWSSAGKIRYSRYEPYPRSLSKMHAMLTQGSSIKARIFEEREAAAKWFGVAVDLLTFSSHR